MIERVKEIVDDCNSKKISELPLDELRNIRDTFVATETDVSFVRRMTQGRLDIVGHDMNSRQSAKSDKSDNTSDLLFELPEILTDQSKTFGSRKLDIGSPGEMAQELLEQLDQMVSPNELSNISQVDDEDLNDIFSDLTSFENELSETRRILHEQIDALQLEIGRRYTDGNIPASL